MAAGEGVLQRPMADRVIDFAKSTYKATYYGGPDSIPASGVV